MAYTTVGRKRPYTHEQPCPKCGKAIEYWWTSGMSESFPHCREEFPEELPFRDRVYSPNITLVTGARTRTES